MVEAKTDKIARKVAEQIPNGSTLFIDIGTTPEAVAHALFGDCAISGKLPWQIPATMDQVMLQREDLPKDIENPLYDYGFGIEVAAFGQ